VPTLNFLLCSHNIETALMSWVITVGIKSAQKQSAVDPTGLFCRSLLSCGG
jgi:hypothetical protein